MIGPIPELIVIVFRQMLIAIPIAFYLASTPLKASGATFEFIQIPEIKHRVLMVRGKIFTGDAKKFQTFSRGISSLTVHLESPGGLIMEALDIASQIHLAGFTTMVNHRGNCFSACAIIWVSGKRRYLSASSNLGFHAAYRFVDGVAYESGVGNAVVGAFLNEIGIGLDAIKYFTIAGPDKFAKLTPRSARSLGIDIYELVESNIITPTDLPSGHNFLWRLAKLERVSRTCSSIYKLNRVGLKILIKRNHRNAIQSLSKKQIEKMIYNAWNMEIRKFKLEGQIVRCVGLINELIALGSPNLVLSPSFDCSLSRTATEKSICKFTELWAKDTAIANVYFGVRRKIKSSRLRALWLRSQRNWLKVRNKCDGGRYCLNYIYDQRIAELNTSALIRYGGR